MSTEPLHLLCRLSLVQIKMLTGSVTTGTDRSLTVMLFLPVHSAPSIFLLSSCLDATVTFGRPWCV